MRKFLGYSGVVLLFGGACLIGGPLESAQSQIGIASIITGVVAIGITSHL